MAHVSEVISFSVVADSRRVLDWYGESVEQGVSFLAVFERLLSTLSFPSRTMSVKTLKEETH